MSTTHNNEKTSKKKDSKFIKKVKQKIYAWHKTIGIITIVPVIFWTLSGIMHPFMAHFFKPTIANEQIEKVTIDSVKNQLFPSRSIAKKPNQHLQEFQNSNF